MYETKFMLIKEKHAMQTWISFPIPGTKKIFINENLTPTCNYCFGRSSNKPRLRNRIIIGQITGTFLLKRMMVPALLQSEMI